MRAVPLLCAILLLFTGSHGAAAQGAVFSDRGVYSLEAGIGLDVVSRLKLGGTLKYNVFDHVVLASQAEVARSVRSMGALVGIPRENFSSKSSLSTLRFGAGTTFGTPLINHTLLLLGGPQYAHLRETHHYRDLEPATVASGAWVVDAGFQYGVSIGAGRAFVSSTLYLPLTLIPDNLMGLTLSLGAGFRPDW